MPNQTAPVTTATDIPTAGAVAGSSTEPVISITVKPSPFGWLLDGLVISPANTRLNIRYRAMPAEKLPAEVQKLAAELLGEWHGLSAAVQATPQEEDWLLLMQIERADAKAGQLAMEAKKLLEWIEQARTSGKVVPDLLLARYSLASLQAEQAASFHKSLIRRCAGIATPLEVAA